MERPNLIKHCLTVMYKIVRNKGVPPQDQEDLVQETCLKVFASRPYTNNAIQDLPSYMAICTYNAVSKYFERRTKLLHLLDSLDEQHERITIAELEEGPIKELLEELQRGIAQLPEKQCESIRLQLLGYSYKEIAVALEITEGAVRGYIARAKENLRKFFGIDPDLA